MASTHRTEEHVVLSHVSNVENQKVSISLFKSPDVLKPSGKILRSTGFPFDFTTVVPGRLAILIATGAILVDWEARHSMIQESR